MKRILILSLICLITLFLFACDTPLDTNTSTDTNTDTTITENGYIKASVNAIKEAEKIYYTKIPSRFGNYLGNDLPSYQTCESPYYKVIKSYESFCNLFSYTKELDKEVFDEHYILLIYKEYADYEIGFKNFETGDDLASIDYVDYYSDDFAISAIESWHMNIILIPNTVSCSENDFKPITLNKKTIYTYPCSEMQLERITINDNEAFMFTSQEHFEAFKEKYEPDYYDYIIKKNSIYIVIKTKIRTIAFEDLTLDNNKLTIKAHAIDKMLDSITVVEIPREKFTEEITSDVSLEIQYTIHNQNSNDLSVTKEEWQSAFDFIANNNENVTEEIHLSYIAANGKEFNGVCKYLTADNKRAEISDGFQYYYDDVNGCYYEVQNGIWKKHNGDIIIDSAFSFCDYSPIKYAYDSATYTSYTGLYKIDKYEKYTDIQVRIKDGKLEYISFSMPSAWREDSKDTFKIYYYDFGTTEIFLPNEGDNALNGMIAINRAEKVTINLDYHSLADEIEDCLDDKTKHYAGYVCINQNGNEYIAYAPNVYTYYTAITVDRNQALKNETYNKINRIQREYFNDSPEYNKIDIVEIGNIITIYFPDFDSYFECQEDMLNTLSQLKGVKSIEVGYVDTQDKYTRNFETYETIVLSRDMFEKDHLCIVYENLNYVTIPDSITKETFDEYYVFIVNSYDYRNKISDARLVGNTVYLTNNRYYTPNTLEDAIDRSCSFIVLVPKSELGTLPEVVEVKTLQTYIID